MTPPPQNTHHDPTVDVLLRKFFLKRSKLKAVNRTSALLAGFAMVTMVEMSLDSYENDQRIHEPLFIAYSLLTALLVGVHIVALMISTVILSFVDFIPSDETSAERIEFMSDKAFEAADNYIDLAWILSTFMGLFLFLIDLALVCWIKFEMISRNAAIVATAVIIAALSLMFVIAFDLRRKMSKVRIAIRRTELRSFRNKARRLPQTPTVVAATSGRRRKRRRMMNIAAEIETANPTEISDSD